MALLKKKRQRYLTKYFTGNPCKYGHIAYRNRSGNCIECRKLKGKERNREGQHYAYRKRTGTYNPKWRQKIRATHYYSLLISDAKKRSKNKGLEFNLTIDWGKARWDGKCELTKIAFDLTHNKPHAVYHSPTLDRIDPKRGYTQDNCRFVLWAINTFKARASDNEMYVIAQALLDNKKGAALD